MHRFDIALVGVRRGRDAEMLAVPQGGGEARALASGIVATDEFAAIVGLPGQMAQIDAAAIQVLLDARGEDRAGRRGTFLCERPEQQATANLLSSPFADQPVLAPDALDSHVREGQVEHLSGCHSAGEH